MNRKIWILALVAGAIGVYFAVFHESEPAVKTPEAPKQQPLAQSKHSAAFNASIDKALNDYYTLSESLVKWDSGAVRAQAGTLQASLGAITWDELKKDTAIYMTAVSYKDMFNGDLQTMQSASDLTERRRAFHSLSQNFYDVLRVVRYDAAPIYMQECPMAFNDTEPAVWLANSTRIRNPYLGLHHPEHRNTMLSCGLVKDSLKLATTK
ncbi:DUF3347 domain-containing protein [Flaviaesturariibacter amylovorans]|uniref:DUF3347 domain-containing protein n=1 Tax=Flaviaesturariibacter amylovorans TaxID=1084520 RepID=A0ABP8GWX0_9BACT